MYGWRWTHMPPTTTWASRSYGGQLQTMTKAQQQHGRYLAVWRAQVHTSSLLNYLQAACVLFQWIIYWKWISPEYFPRWKFCRQIILKFHQTYFHGRPKFAKKMVAKSKQKLENWWWETHEWQKTWSFLSNKAQVESHICFACQTFSMSFLGTYLQFGIRFKIIELSWLPLLVSNKSVFNTHHC